MILLDSTTKSLQVLLGGAITTNQLTYVAGYADLSATGTVLGESDGLTNNGTAVTPVSAPAASTTRKVLFLNIQNSDTANADVTVRVNNNGTFRKLVVATLIPGDTLVMNNEGWKVISTDGSTKVTASTGASALSDLTDTAIVSATTGDYLRYNGTDWANVAITQVKTDLAGTYGPIDADYLVKTANSTLTAERVVTDTASVTVDWGTAGQAKFNVASIPSDTPMSGSLLATAIVAPSTPAAGKAEIYVDSTSKNIAVKDDAGAVKHGVKTKASVSNSFVTAIDDDGTVTVAQPTDANLSVTDVTTNNASTSAHGFVVKATAPASGLINYVGIGNGETAYTNKALFDTTNPAALGTAGPGTSLIAARRDHVHANPAIDTLAAATDITTLNASTSAHGLLPKLDNTATHFLNGQGGWTTPAGGGKPFMCWTPAGNNPPTSAYATPDTRNSHPTLDFDGSTDEEAVFAGVLDPSYAGGGLTCETWWSFTSATSGSLRVQAAIERMDVSSLDIDADSFASFNSAGGTAPGTSGQFVKVTVTFASGAEMDSLAAGEAFRLKIRRDADGTSGTDDITTDAELLRIVLRET